MMITLFATTMLLTSNAFADTPVDQCDASVLNPDCKPAPMSAYDNAAKKKIEVRSVEITKKLNLPGQIQGDPSVCDAHFNTTYMRMNDRIKVETSIKNESCGASRGEYTLRIRTYSPDRDPQTESIAESWSRDDSGDVLVTNYYPISVEDDFGWVRINSSRSSACHCVHAVADRTSSTE